MTKGILKDLVGKKAQADWPITSLNPKKYFFIHEAKIDRDKLFVRGEETCWFEGEMVNLVEGEKTEIFLKVILYAAMFLFAGSLIYDLIRGM